MMKKNMLMRPSSWLGILLSLSSLLHVSCEGCHPGQLDRDKDSVIAIIEMSTPESITYIHGALLVETAGKITENNIPAPSKLCLLLIPKGKEVKKAIETFQNSNKKLGKGDQEVSYIPLSATLNEGAVYYMKELLGSDRGEMSETVLVKGLPAGDYEAYLILANEGYPTVFSNKQDLNLLPPPNKTVDPFVTMVDVLAETDTTTADALLITANATVDNPKGVEGGGFLFINKEDTTLDAITIIADFLKSGGDILPSTPAFTPLGKALVHPLPNVVAGNNQLKAQAKDNIFKRGATHKVYGWLLYTDQEGNQRYVVSDPVEMLIPKPVVKLKIKEAKIVELIRCVDDLNVVAPTDSFSVEYDIEIIQNEGTTKPQIGLLFVKGVLVDEKAGIQKIQNLLTKAPRDNYYQDGDDLVCLIGDIAKIQATISTPFVPLKLGETYHVYGLVGDGNGKGQIFLSENEVSLTVPSVDLRVDKFATDKDEEKFLLEKVHDIQKPVYSTGLGNKVSAGYIILKKGDLMTKGFLESLLQNINRLDPDPKQNGYKSQIGNADCNFMDMDVLKTPDVTSTCVGIYTGKPQGPIYGVYDVYIVVSCENAVLWKSAPATEKFIWYEPDKPNFNALPVNDWDNTVPEYDNKQYAYNNKTTTLYEVQGKNFIPIKYVNAGTNDALIRALLGCIYKGPNSLNKIQAFIKAMDKV